MSHRRAERGFTLIEVLVAFAILALSMGALMVAFGSSAKLSAASESRARALLHAESVLDALSIDLSKDTVTQNGSFDDGFRWEATIEPYGGDEDHEAWIAAAYDVSVRVFWGRKPVERNVELRTLRLVPKGFQ